MDSERLRLLPCLLTAMLLFLLPASFAVAVNDEQYNLATDTVLVAVDDIPVSFSPYAASPLAPQYAHLFFEPLVRWGKEQQLEKRLLEEWESIKPGVIRFYLKKNIKFHSGNKLSSRDVTWTFSQILKEPQAKRFFEGIKSIKQVDHYRFDVYSSLSEAQLLDYLTHFFVLDAAFYQRNKIDLNKAQGSITAQNKKLSISGTGPYKIKKYNSALHLNVVSNKDYWQGEAVLKELNFIKIRSADSRSFALLTGDVDISESVSNNMINTVNQVTSKSLVEVSSSNVLFLTIDDKRSDILKHKIVRDAIDLAINKEGMLKHIINGMGSVGSVYTPLNQAERELPAYDVAKAKVILNKINIPTELALLILVDEIGNTPQVANALMNMMRRVGIKLFITKVTSIEEWNKRLLDYDLTLSVWHSPLMNSYNIYHELFVDSVLSRYLSVKFSGEKLDDSINKQALFFEQMQHDHQVIPLLFQNKIWATDKKYNLPAIFSVNGIPYWHLLTTQ